uniref:PABC domain-containing protein n=1 Tax=Noctiluca scintillans TaxID=2966 RepID=A0A7S1F905_NOCSC
MERSPVTSYGGLSGQSYVGTCLRIADAEHFSAAGVLPYRRKGSRLELLLARERPWNSFSKAYDPMSLNVVGGKRIRGHERDASVTATRVLLESTSTALTEEEAEMLQGLICGGSFLWYAKGRFALSVVDFPKTLWDLPERFSTTRQRDQGFTIQALGTKKWAKQIKAFEWVPVRKLTPRLRESVSDLLLNVLRVSGLEKSMDGTRDSHSTSLRARNECSLSSTNVRHGRLEGNVVDQATSSVTSVQAFYVPSLFTAFQITPPEMMTAPLFQTLEEMQRQLYGEQLLALVQVIAPSPFLAQKITGMLLELPEPELLVNFTDQAELDRRVCEALYVLREDGFV